MTDNNHPITPPPELVRQWAVYKTGHESPEQLWDHVATQAARWGSDQELEACCEWMERVGLHNYALLAARRPKPPSLKELALASVKRFEESGEFFSDQMRELEFIRKALEQLDDQPTSTGCPERPDP